MANWGATDQSHHACHDSVTPSRRRDGSAPPACVDTMPRPPGALMRPPGRPQRLIPDDQYRMLQTALMLRPDAGKLIKGSGGLRKIRWNLPGTGKRGALRVIYYWKQPETIFMLFPYRKSDQEDLTINQLKIIREMVKELLQ